jgi:fibronectin-binding autotransporter adhesin
MLSLSLSRCRCGPSSIPVSEASRLARAAGAVCLAGSVLGSLGFAEAASAQTLNWANANGGSAATAGNWSPAQVPTAANPLVFNIASALPAIPVTFPLAAAASASQTFRQESYLLTMSSPHTTSGAVQIGLNATDVAAATLTTGQWSMANLFVGQANGASGTLSINDDDASVIVSGSSAVNNGSIGITGGGLFEATNTLTIANGSVVNAAGQLGVPPFSRSRLEGSIVNLSGVGAASAINVTSGALATVGVLSVGGADTGTGAVTIQNAGLVPATINADTVRIGGNANGTPAGTGSVNVLSGGMLDVIDSIAVGDINGGTGTLRIDGTGSVVTPSLSVVAGGSLDLDGGTLTIDGGTLTYTNAASHLAIGGASSPVLSLINGAQCNLSVVTGGRVLGVGGASAGIGLADLDVRSGSDLVLSGLGITVLGESVGDDGGMIISGVGSSLSTPVESVITVGQSGAGRLEAELGATATIGRVSIALNPGSTGMLLIQNPGTTATTNEIAVGGGPAAAGGNGDFVVNAGASVNVNSDQPNGVRVWPGGFLQVAQGSTLTASKPVRVSGGDVDLEDGGTITAPQFVLESGSVMEINGEFPTGGSCTVNANTAMSGSSIINMFGDLTIGNAASTNGFSGSNTTTMNLHGHTLTILNGEGSGVGTINLTSAGDPAGSLGTVIAAQPLFIVLGADISGAGTFQADVTMIGAGTTMTMTGAGITFDGLLTNNPGGAISGPASSVLQFLPNGGYTGNGTIAARVNAHVKSTITATGNLTMGLNSTSGVTIGGVLKCGTHLVTLIDSNGVTLGTKTEFIDTVLTQSVTLGVPPKSIFQGMGTVDTGLLSLNGDIRPGDTDAAGPETDTITCTGDVQIGAQTEYLCHLGPPGFGEEFPQSDRIQTTGAGDVVQINGGTLDVQLLTFYTPQSSDKFDVVKGFAGVTGTFDAHILPPGARVSYLPNAVRVHFCYPDCDGDGTLSIDDFICFQTEYALGIDTADCEADGILDINDFICFQTFYAIGC